MTRSRSPRTTGGWWRAGRLRTALSEFSDAAWMTLVSDRLLQISVGFAVAFPTFLLLPILPQDLRRTVVSWAGPVIFALLILYAFLHGASTRGRAREDAFWRDLVLAAWSTSAAIVLRRLAAAVDWDPAVLLGRMCLVVTYTFLVVAVERQPHRESVESKKTELRLTLPTILLLVMGLLFYFAVLPALAFGGSVIDLSHMPQIFTALGIVLVARLVFLTATTESPRWRALYAVLGLLAATMVLGHGRGLPTVVERLGPKGMAASLLWLPPMLLAVFLARLRHHPFRPDRRIDSDLVTRLGDHPAGLALRTMFVALAVPVLHFGAYRFGLFDAAYEGPRETWVFFWILGLGAIAVYQNRHLSDRLTSAFRERRRIESALANTERSLRLAAARKRSEEAVWNKKEKYVKAFRYSPDAMLLTTLEDGRLLEFNNRFLGILGYRRDEVTERTVFEIDLWADLKEREEMTAALRRNGYIRNTEFRVRTRSGAERRVRVSAELMEVAGETCLFAVARDVTAHEESLSSLQRQAALLDRADEPITVIDRNDVVTYSNAAAARLLGIPSEEMHGKPVADVLSSSDPEAVRTASRETRRHGVWRGTLSAGLADGRELRLDAVWSLVTDAEGAASAKVIFFR